MTSILVSGSMAIDTVLSCPQPFGLNAEHVKQQRLATAFYMPNMHHVWGGCAGNIAYGLKQLGINPIIIATMGNDSGTYISYLNQHGINTDYIQCLPNHLTAKAVILNDSIGQQLTGFHPGAMNEAHTQTAFNALDEQKHIQWGIVSPDGKQAMINRCHELSQRNVSFIIDLGQATPIFTREEVIELITLPFAYALAVNEHEATVLENTLGCSLKTLNEQYQCSILITLGDQGLNWITYHTDKNIATIAHIEAIKGIDAVDPTGCGDSLRAAWLFGLSCGVSAIDSLRFGNLMGAYKVQYQGAQGYSVSLSHLKTLWLNHYPSHPIPFQIDIN